VRFSLNTRRNVASLVCAFRFVAVPPKRSNNLTASSRLVLGCWACTAVMRFKRPRFHREKRLPLATVSRSYCGGLSFD
jgi:hypothetical protein